MNVTALLKAQVQLKRIYVLLTEVHDISQQLADALDRNDQVTARLLISMRSEPIQKLGLARAALEEQKIELPEAEGERLAALLNGAAPQNDEEQAFATQVKTNNRLLAQVLDLDKVLNLKIGREKSIYYKK